MSLSFSLSPTPSSHSHTHTHSHSLILPLRSSTSLRSRTHRIWFPPSYWRTKRGKAGRQKAGYAHVLSLSLSHTHTHTHTHTRSWILLRSHSTILTSPRSICTSLKNTQHIHYFTQHHTSHSYSASYCIAQHYGAITNSPQVRRHCTALHIPLTTPPPSPHTAPLRTTPFTTLHTTPHHTNLFSTHHTTPFTTPSSHNSPTLPPYTTPPSHSPPLSQAPHTKELDLLILQKRCATASV